jgi:hypothetical protein
MTLLLAIEDYSGDVRREERGGKRIMEMFGRAVENPQ